MFGRKKRSLYDFDEEIQAHIDFEADEFKKDGLDENEARKAALRQFGNVTIARERFYETGRWLWLDALIRDLRFAFRLMRRQPVSTLSIILLLALGTGGVTAVFNPIYSTLFTPLPFPQPEQLVRIGGDIRMFNNYQSRFEKEEFLERIFSNITAYLSSDQNMSTTPQVRISVPETGKHREIYSLWVTENFFETLGVQPLIGSGFSRKENRDGVIISYRIWRDIFMGADDTIGRLIPTGRGQRKIVGIMPEGFNFPADTDSWVCIGNGTSWGIGSTQFVGRLRSGLSSEAAAKELQTFDFNPVPGIIGNGGPVLQPLQTFLYGDQRSLLMLLGAAAVLFLALVGAGVVSLLVAQGERRKQEIATRLIMGASRRSLVFQLLIETLPLVIIGGLAGWWFSEIVNAWLWPQLPALRHGVVDIPVKMAFWAAIVLVVTLIGGLIPSFYATGIDLNAYLKAAADGKRRLFTSREFMVGLQLGLALALLIGEGVLIHSMMFRIDFPIGWSSNDIAVVPPHRTGAALKNERNAMYARSLDIQSELSALPEVMSVGVLSPIPFSPDAMRSSRGMMPVSNYLPTQGQEFPQAHSSMTGIVSPNGFDILGIPLIAGRYFTHADAVNRLGLIGVGGYGSNGGAAIVNQAFAQTLWPEENAVGKTFYDGASAAFEVVGVVRNYHHTPGSNDFIPTMYTPDVGLWTNSGFLVNLRPGASLSSFRSSAQTRLSGLMASTDFEIQLLSEHVKDAMASRNLALKLLGCFAVLGIVVSGLSLYATTTLMAAARNREMGIRMAMGAQFWDILRLAFGRGIRAILIGLPFGLFLAWILSRVLSGYLVQVNVGDPLAWAVSCVVFIVIVTVAALIPALRTARGNPMDALRNE